MAEEIKVSASFGREARNPGFLSELLLGSFRVTDRMGIQEDFHVKRFSDVLAGCAS